MELDRLARWLRCPSCGEDLNPSPPLSLRCPRGHSFDANKRGYVSLLPPGTRVTGDTAGMLAARADFLSLGHYAPIVDALSAAVLGGAEGRSAAASAHDFGGLRIVDAGCGTGFYLHQLLDRVPESRGLAADLSPAAVSAAVRGRENVDGVVADTWAGLPLQDGSADLLLDVFAPRNMREFHRVLAPGGRVAIVAAGSEHLVELRADGRAVGVQADKRERILASADALFDLQSESSVHAVLSLSEHEVDLLLGMGPSAHHRSDAAAHQSTGSSPAAGGAVRQPSAEARTGTRHPVTLDVMIHVLRRRDAPAETDVQEAS
ncbi:methyltransferase domain-containing protein [Clavibacter lycopersici]|uniref:Methyltransferase domain-containing protein n=1 Tax=Clavibacter lycopersici TaxID=2301718 RepID=A0A399TFU3_9MICO|nr:methyltransferase domain-containing protein [Clavibacter lycopersici]RIJ53207.1 methyltransferase domain-containing protein [Clavibacter lycopersici]RIJ62640.1 methyltransferase domain-containing protein [Clavibacter lycopersici]